MTAVVVIGAGGRMGRALVAACAPGGLTLTAAIVRRASALLGQDAGTLAGLAPLGVPVTYDLPAALAQATAGGAPAVAIDFSTPEAAPANLAACVAARCPWLLGTTGLPDLDAPLEAAAQTIPLMVAPNTSLGVALLTELTRLAARWAPGSFDIEIIEAHHRGKRDAPSGTALALGAAAAQGRENPAPSPQPRSGARGSAGRTGEIGYAVVRGGDIAGEHTVLLAGEGEQLALTHRATDRRIFAQGAVRAAAWLAGQRPGRYTLRNLFDLPQ